MKRIILLCIFLFCIATKVQAIELFLWPQNIVVTKDQTFLIDLKVTSDEPLNALDTAVYWQPKELELLSVNTGGSIFDLWVTDTKTPGLGNLKIIAGASTPFQGQGGMIASFLFKAKVDLAQVPIYVGEDTKLVRYGGEAELLDVKLLPAKIDILPVNLQAPVLSSTRIPVEDVWYTTNIFDIRWEQKIDMEYSYLLTMDPTQTPDDVPESLIENIQYEGLADGIYYFVLKYRQVGGEWQNVITRRAMIDTTAPQFNDLRIIEKNDSYGLQKNLFYSVIDDASGISQVTLQAQGQNQYPISSPWEVEKKWFTSQSLELSAIDRAGNRYTRTIAVSALIPWWVWLICLFIIIFITGLLMVRLWRKRKFSQLPR